MEGGSLNKKDQIQRLKKIVSELQAVIKEAEQDERTEEQVRENSPVVLHRAPITAKEKKRMLEDDE